MQGQRLRYHKTGDFHFLTFSCYHRQPYFATQVSRNLFEDALELIRLRYRLAVAGYVVMPEHVHLLLSEPQRAPLSKAVHALKLSVSMRRLERPFWQAHYYDFNVFTHAKFVEKLRYIHRNPVRRGLVAKPEDWAWSSFRHYQTGIRGTVEIESNWTAAQRGWQLPEWLRNRNPASPNSPVPFPPPTTNEPENESTNESKIEGENEGTYEGENERTNEGEIKCTKEGAPGPSPLGTGEDASTTLNPS
jgi:putative transposase